MTKMASEADVGACPCGSPLRAVQFDSWRAITDVAGMTRIPRVAECWAGHEDLTWVTEKMADEEMRRLAEGTKLGRPSPP